MTGSVATLNGFPPPPGVQGADELPSWDFELNPPIEFSNGQTYRTLHLREPQARELRDAQKEIPSTMPTPEQVTTFQIVLVSLVTKVPRGAIEQMRASQLEEAAAFLARLSAGGRATTET